MFRNASFPRELAYGSEGGPAWATDVFTSVAGYEKRRGHYPQSRGRWSISLLHRPSEEIAALLAFFRAVAVGRAYSFRFRDFTDYQFANVIGTGDGGTSSFQLFKQYRMGEMVHNRVITKPDAATVQALINGVPTDQFTVDALTGVLTFFSPPPAGALITALGEYDYVVRFAADTLQLIAVDPGPGGRMIFSTETIELLECVNEDPDLWQTVWIEKFEYVPDYVAWVDGPKLPMTAPWDVDDWDSYITGFTYDQNITETASFISITRIKRRVTLSGVGGVNNLRAVPLHPLTARPAWPTGGFAAFNLDIQYLLTVAAYKDDPLDPVTGSHWARMLWFATTGPPGTTGPRAFAFELEVDALGGAITRWRWGYWIGQGGGEPAAFVVLNEGPCPGSGTVSVRLVTRNPAQEIHGTETSVYFSPSVSADFATLPLLFRHRSRLGDRDWHGERFSNANQLWEMYTQTWGTATMQLTNVRIQGYDDEALATYLTYWQGVREILTMEDVWEPIVPPGGILLRLNFYRAPGMQRFYLGRANPPLGYRHVRLRALWQVRASVGTSTAYVGLYCLAGGVSTDMNWRACGVLVELSQSLGTTTRVLFVSWPIFANMTTFTVHAEAPFVRSLTALMSLELEWMNPRFADSVTFTVRAGSNANYSFMSPVLSGTATPTIPDFPRQEGPVAIFDYDGSPTQALDIALDEIEMQEIVVLPGSEG